MGQAATAKKLKPIHEIRKRNLNALIESKFDGNNSEAARVIERSHTYLWQLAEGYRGIGELSARHIESKLKLIPGSLDAAKTGRTKTLKADDGQGNVKDFFMVPLLSLDALDAKPKEFVPLPFQYFGDVFCAIVEAEDVVELEEHDRIFVDRKKALQLVDKRLYVVQHKKTKEVVVLMSRKRSRGWTFGATGEDAKPSDEFNASTVEILGRVILIMRHTL